MCLSFLICQLEIIIICFLECCLVNDLTYIKNLEQCLALSKGRVFAIITAIATICMYSFNNQIVLWT